MLTVEIHSITQGCCTWCGKEKGDVVTFSFSDKSFNGSMCWNDLKRALKMKCPSATLAAPAATDAKAAVRV